MSNNARFEFQLKMLENGGNEIHKNIGQLVDILFKIKTSAVTVWVALIGWSFIVRNLSVIPLGFIAIGGFWLMEGIFQGFHFRHLNRCKKLAKLLNDTKVLDEYFNSSEFPPNVIYETTGFDESVKERFRLLCRGLIAPSVAILYLFLIAINSFIWLLVKSLG
jgi:hypothetical protein